jgi:hypothetical protein
MEFYTVKITPPHQDSEPAENDMVAIKNAIETADMWGLRLEVLWSAMRILQSDPSISIATAMECRLNDWEI